MSDQKKNQVGPNIIVPAVSTNVAAPAILPPPVPQTLTIPLFPTIRAAYQELYDQYEDAIQKTEDVNLLESLNDSKDAVGMILSLNAQYALSQNTAAYQALQTQITSTNTNLLALQRQIEAIADKVQTLGTVLGAINKVLGLAGV